tara:strand:- start:392 stop:1414 length:1023 start_codon:yes stop_codon:yes gene_type:complete
MNVAFIIGSIITIFFLNNLLIKKNFLPSIKGEKHQKYINKKSIPLSGGVFFLIGFIFIFYQEFSLLFFFLICMFSLGIFSDLKIISSPVQRLLLQTALVIFIVYFLNLEINSTRISLIDNLLKNNLINLLFISFCMIILINGSNFIDGLNGLLLLYSTLVLYVLLKLGLFEYSFDNKTILSFIIFLTIILIFNFCNFFFLGDSGAYSIGLVLGFLLISVYQFNPYISPYFIILLLWYPCFEILFSIIRKFRFNYSPIRPDINHLHQLIFFILKKKFFKKKDLISNNMASIIINLYNFLLFLIASNYYTKTDVQLILMTLSMLIYVFVYQNLLKLKKKDIK